MKPTHESVPATALKELAVPRRSWWSLVREDARCVLERDPAARSLLEVWTIYPGVQAIALHRMAHSLWRRGWRYGPRWISFAARWLTQVDIHPGASIGMRFFIDHGAGVVIGETAEIGNDVTLYHGVTLGGTSWSAGNATRRWATRSWWAQAPRFWDRSGSATGRVSRPIRWSSRKCRQAPPWSAFRAAW